jgi:hypothetical protein
MTHHTIDDEWQQFLQQGGRGPASSVPGQANVSVQAQAKVPVPVIVAKTRLMLTRKPASSAANNVDSSVEVEPEDDDTESGNDDEGFENLDNLVHLVAPKCDELYISTKTKVLFLNQKININDIFWNIPVIDYWRPMDGVVKKQIKIVSKTPDEYEEYRKKLDNIGYYKENIIKQIDNASGRRVKYRDERKLTVGISKKDIMNCRGKVKNAFYNCFAIIVRFKFEGIYREIHIKVFNTGKLEIPGILNVELLEIVKKMLLEKMQPHIDTKLDYLESDVEENVLINSNFNCGFYINRDKLYSILRSDKYRIESAFDPCSYPGVKCKFYFNNEVGFDEQRQNGQIILEDRYMKMSELGDNVKYTEVSFMIFRTGSCLIVGNCTERILRFVFEFIKRILRDEYGNIVVENKDEPVKAKKTKLRKKTILSGGPQVPLRPPP